MTLNDFIKIMLENQFRRFVLGEVKRLIFAALVSVHILYGDNITAVSKCHSSRFDDTSLSGDINLF